MVSHQIIWLIVLLPSLRLSYMVRQLSAYVRPIRKDPSIAVKTYYQLVTVYLLTYWYIVLLASLQNFLYFSCGRAANMHVFLFIVILTSHTYTYSRLKLDMKQLKQSKISRHM